MARRRFVGVNGAARTVVHLASEVDGGALRLVVEERGDEPIPELVAILAGVLLCSSQVGAGRDELATNFVAVCEKSAETTQTRAL